MKPEDDRSEGLRPRAINPLQGAPGQPTLWTLSYRTPARPPLRNDVRANVCVIGAGMSGMSVAYQLAKAGAEVVVLDDGAIGSGMTSRTTAHLTSAIDDRFYEIERMHGAEVSRLAAGSERAAIDEVERIVRHEGIDCDFMRVPGYLMLPRDGSLELLDRDLEAARRAGVPVERVATAPLEGFDTGPCNRFDDQGQFHPLKYLGGLVGPIEKSGGRVCLASHVEEWLLGNPGRVKTQNGATVTADAVVFATNVPINDRVVVHNKQAPYLTHVIAARVPAGSVAQALFWDLADPYHYVRLAPTWRDEDRGYEFLIVGGEDYKTGQGGDDDPMRAYARIETWARKRFPKMEGVTHQWSGQVMEPVDGLPYIGRNPLDAENVYVVTGDSGMGMTHGTIAGMLIRDLIMGRENPWAKMYDPARKATGAALQYAKENLNVAGQLLKHFAGDGVRSVDEIPRDSGAVIRKGLGKTAVYRDLAGHLHRMSATCPHLGCVVDWNQAERTWDCPCHGSRFDAIGKPISGPANSPLAPETEETKSAKEAG
jgi:glycine/D-amino acid oxidase-like deaminating enzyme/nitrite reductase/ring-hydroxylating ferredoxin subunit